MSVHVKEDIRTRLVDLIEQGVTEFTSVVATRIRPTSRVPWCSVSTPTMAQAAEDNGGWPKRFYDVDVEIVIGVAAVAGYDLLMDDLEAKVTALISAEPTLGGSVKLISLLSSDDEWDDMLDKPAGRLRMVWRALVRVDGRSPQAAIA